jgi:hypothetical protein
MRVAGLDTAMNTPTRPAAKDYTEYHELGRISLQEFGADESAARRVDRKTTQESPFHQPEDRKGIR